MPKFAYFPGCSLHGTSKGYNKSVKSVCEALGIELWDVPDWNCCGSTPAKSTNSLLATLLASRNLALAEKEGLDTIVACAACFNALKFAEKEMKENKETQDRVNQILKTPYTGKIGVKNFIEVIHEAVCQNGGDLCDVKKPLSGLKIASYYGCLWTRPMEVTEFEDPENPTSLDEIFKALGAEAVDWFPKTKCCGASFAISEVRIVLERVKDIMRYAKEQGADFIATACPLCQSNLDLRQRQIRRKKMIDYNIPVVFFTDLLGISLGLGKKRLSLGSYYIDPRRILKSKGLI
jgi:heterodisulfide reductase subunit B